jgi:glycosyltransferase involved in cell wall biosynthesis
VLIGVDASRITRRQRTGTENYSLNVLRLLLAQDHNNAYRLYLNEPLPAGLLPRANDRVTQRVIRMPRLWTQVGLSAEMRRAQPDVLFVPSHVLPLVSPKRSVVVIYDVGHRFFPRAHGVLEWLYVEWAIRRHVRIASALLTISEASKRDIVQLYGADPNRIAVAYPAVDERFRPATRAEVARVRSTHGLTERYVLHLSTIKPRKNLPRLIRAFAQANLPGDTQLALGGMTTSGGPAVEQAIAETGLHSRVRRLAYVPDADLPALYGGASAVALVSLYEGFGMPALEALACGAPVVVGNRGSLPEIVADAGLIVNVLDVGSIAAGLEQAINDRRTADKLHETGPRRAASFTWDQAARVTLEVLECVGQGAASTALASAPPSAAN